MQVDRLLGGADLTGLCPAFSREPGVFLGQGNAIISDDDAIQIPLLVDVDRFSGIHILSDECAVENSQLLGTRGPCRAVERCRSTLQLQFDGWVSSGTQGLTADHKAGIVSVKGTQDGADRCFTESVRP